MMGDLKKRASFAKLVNYVNNPKKARLIDSKDVRLDNNATIAASMQGQADDKPGRKLKNPVYHISLDFAHEDTPKLTDGLMTEIAREYMKRMGIVNTQYLVCRLLLEKSVSTLSANTPIFGIIPMNPNSPNSPSFGSASIFVSSPVFTFFTVIV